MEPTKNIKKFLKELKKLNLPKDKFAVFAGGVLAVRGLREVYDLDLVVLPELWLELAKKYPVEKTEDGRGKIHFGENVEAVSQPSFGFKAQEVIGKADIVGGIRFVNLGTMKKWKRKMGRKKDLQDVELMEKYLKAGGE